MQMAERLYPNCPILVQNPLFQPRHTSSYLIILHTQATLSRLWVQKTIMIVMTDSNRLGINSDRLPLSHSHSPDGRTEVSVILIQSVPYTVTESTPRLWRKGFFFDYDPKMLDSVGVYK
jgi:hypothetical protein